MNQESSASVRLSASLTPLRLVLLAFGAIVLGLALSVLLSSGSAHAAERVDPGPGDGLLAGSTAVAGDTVEQAATTAASVVEPVATPIAPVTAAATARVTTVAGQVETTAPVTSTLVTPVTAVLSTTVGAVQQLASLSVVEVGAVRTPLAFDERVATAAATVHLATGDSTAAAAIHEASTVVSAAATVGGVISTLPVVPSLPGSGNIPSPLLTSAQTIPVGLLGTLFVVAAFALLTARRRASDDALPSSPVFETDTSPA